MVATPHGDSRATWSDTNSLRNACDTINETLQAEHIQLSVVLGMENPLEPNMAERIKSGFALTYNETQHLLVEFPYTHLPLFWEEELFQLQLDGKYPVIAHPERQVQIQDNPRILEGVVSRGVLVQITAGSLTRKFGSRVRKCAETLLKDQLAHVIASDAHSSGGSRPPDLLEGFNAAAQLIGKEQATRMMTEVPRSIALGHPKTSPD